VAKVNLSNYQMEIKAAALQPEQQIQMNMSVAQTVSVEPQRRGGKESAFVTKF